VEVVASRLGGLAPETIGVIELLAAGEPLSMSMLEESPMQRLSRTPKGRVLSTPTRTAAAPKPA
jgi:hypothetical protein